jgi:hypothetical protein
MLKLRHPPATTARREGTRGSRVVSGARTTRPTVAKTETAPRHVRVARRVSYKEVPIVIGGQTRRKVARYWWLVRPFFGYIVPATLATIRAGGKRAAASSRQHGSVAEKGSWHG